MTQFLSQAQSLFAKGDAEALKALIDEACKEREEGLPMPSTREVLDAIEMETELKRKETAA